MGQLLEMAFRKESKTALLNIVVLNLLLSTTVFSFTVQSQLQRQRLTVVSGWVERNGEWAWVEDDPSYISSPIIEAASTVIVGTSATPKLPSGSYRPKQSLGQNYLKDPNTVAKLLRAFHQDAIRKPSGDINQSLDVTTDHSTTVRHVVELGPGAGALTDKLVEIYGAQTLQCIEIDERSVALLRDKHPTLDVQHADVLQVNYADLAAAAGGQPLIVVGNLPYYITSQILFALADASHLGAVRSATVTMQWEVGQRMVAPTHCKDYGILSVVFQLYCESVKCHFKIPPTVFYPQPKVDSALLGLHFLGPNKLRRRLAGVRPEDLRRVVTVTFQQRRKTVRNSLKKLCMELYNDATRVEAILNSGPLPLPDVIQKAASAGDAICQKQALPLDWATKRPEELSPGQFVELTRLVFGCSEADGDSAETRPLGAKVWRKLKHGANGND